MNGIIELKLKELDFLGLKQSQGKVYLARTNLIKQRTLIFVVCSQFWWNL